jgi:transcriptional regulator with XRE-family HTH domain
MYDKETMLHNLGCVIARRRTAMHCSQMQLAQNASVHRSYVSDVERGIRNITLATLESIANALNTNSAVLLAEAYEWKSDVSAEGSGQA